MHRLLTLMTVGLICLSCTNRIEKSAMNVTYVANCGFLIETDESKIIIDGLLAGFENRYYHLPSDSVVDLMRNGTEPFDDIDLIFFTHAHVDHFDADVTAAHVANSPEAIIVGPPLIDEALQATAQYNLIKDRVRIIPAPTDSITSVQLAGVAIRALPSAHSPYWDEDTLTGEKSNRHANVQHLEYVIVMDGRTLYHCGDAHLNDLERYRSFGFGDSSIDLAMVDWWDARENITFTQKLVRDIIRPERVIMMHMFPNRPPRGEPEKQILVAPMVIRPEYLMQSWTLD